MPATIIYRVRLFLGAFLLLLFYGLVNIALLKKILPDSMATVMEHVLRPDIRPSPWPWVFGQVVVPLGPGVLGLVVIGTTVAPEIAWLRLEGIARRSWRRIVWAGLLGIYGLNVLDFLVYHGPDYDGWTFELIRFGLSVLGLLAVYRLLFAHRRRRYDVALGYGLAIAEMLNGFWALLIGRRGLGVFFDFHLSAYSVFRISMIVVGMTAGTWAGLCLARRRDTNALPWTRATVGYVLASGLLLPYALGNISRMALVSMLPGAVIACYDALIIGFVCFVGINLCRAVGPIGDLAIESVDLTPSSSKISRWRFVIDSGIGVVVSFMLAALGFMPFEHAGEAMAFIMPTVFLLVLGGPVIVFMYGVLRGRLGYSVGAVLMVAGGMISPFILNALFRR